MEKSHLDELNADVHHVFKRLIELYRERDISDESDSLRSLIYDTESEYEMLRDSLQEAKALYNAKMEVNKKRQANIGNPNWGLF